MTEREFDIQVRNLLQNAEEPVSPSVWEGVAAGLDKRRRVVPFRIWGISSAVAVAAAAAVALFVFLKPAAPVVDPAHSNPHSIFMSEASGETLPETEVASVQEEAPVSVVQVPRSTPQRLALSSEEPVPEKVPVRELSSVRETPEMPEMPEVPDVPEIPETPEAQAAQAANDNALLNELAFQEKQEKRHTGVSFTTFGNVQSNQRGALQGNIRRFGAPPLNQQVGIYNESPEISFNLPFSVGVGAQFNFSPRWALGVGIRYTNLQRAFVGDYKGDGFYITQTDIDNQQNWLGVPVNVYYNFVNSGRWHVHAFAGASAEWLLDNHFLIHNSPSDIHYHQSLQRHTQWSAGLGVGLEFQITPFLALYADPGFRYFLGTDKQPRSLRTIQPLRFDIEAGLKFSFGK